MTIKKLREMRDATPFRSFQVHVADGRALSVATPDHIFLFPNQTDVLVVLPDDSFHFLDAGAITGVSGRLKSKGSAQ